MSSAHRSSNDLLQQAIEALSQAARERVAKHPLGHLANGRGGVLELTLQIPMNVAGDVPAEFVGQTRHHLEREIESLLAHRAAFQPGRVWCIRCAAADCEHSAPESPRQVFAGYGATGIPQFTDFGQWLLELHHPEIDQLYRRPPRLVTDVTSGAELTQLLLPAFRESRLDYRIHGQVTAGWFSVPPSKVARQRGRSRDEIEIGGAVALTFQVLSTARKGHKGRRGRRGRRRLGLNILGTGPTGEPLAELYDRLGSIPWAGAVRWSQEALESIERSQGKKSATPERLSGRIEGILRGIARRLQHHRRSQDRRTGHAQKRHKEGDRPTHMALRDLNRAGDDHVLLDLRRETLIVLGDKGRAHVWTAAGKLVTSIRYSPDSIEKKKNLEIWRQAKAPEIAALRKAVS